MNDNVKFAGLLVLMLALVVIGPLLFIWAINTLFAMGIAYTFINWLAASVLMMFLHQSQFNRK